MKFMPKLFVFISLLVVGQCLSISHLEEEFAKHVKSESICIAHFNGTILSHPTDCHKFYVCVNMQPHEYNCETNFHFDKATHSCMPGSECDNTQTGVPATCTEGSVNAIDEDCYIFEACVNGQYQKVNCPTGYYFSAEHSMCRPIHYNANFKCNCVLPDHSVLENRDNCETFYLCANKMALLEKCPLGQYYNSSINACLPDLEGICLMKPTKAPLVHLKTEIDKLIDTGAKALCKDLGKGEVHFQPIEGACNKFYVCANGSLYIQDCPKGFYYEADKQFCVVDTENVCKDGQLTLAASTESKKPEDIGKRAFAKFLKH